MNLLFFDTETTGTHSAARITQIAWQLYTDALLQNAHDALSDIRATSRCFFELQARGIITID